MTITIGWVTHFKESAELVIVSDSRLRSYGALDQCQKIFPLERGDCCLGFCGDAQIAYPLFVQVGTTLDNNIKTRTRALDVTQVQSLVGQILNNLIDSWDISSSEKVKFLADTRILFGGWSWLNKRFDIGFFVYENTGFRFHHKTAALPHPWQENTRSFVFLGDYKKEYTECLAQALAARYETPKDRSEIATLSLRYEPLEALQTLLNKRTSSNSLPNIGGAPQMVKIYPYGNSLPFVIRTAKSEHFLFGRKLFGWEKTERPIVDLSTAQAKISYPMTFIPSTKEYPTKAFLVNEGEEAGLENPPMGPASSN